MCERLAADPDLGVVLVSDRLFFVPEDADAVRWCDAATGMQGYDDEQGNEQ